MRISKGNVERAKTPSDKDQAFYRDDKLKGFALRVTAKGVKSFVVETLIGNKVRRITLGQYGKLTAVQARKEAQKILGKIATGGDPVADRKEAKVKTVTLKEVFDKYIQTRNSLKPTTIADYERVMLESFDDWKKKPLLEITKDMVAKRHTRVGERSHARANLAMRLLRALFNFAMGQYEDTKGRSLITENPVKRLSQSRSWFRVEKRQGYIKAHELKPWYEGVSKLENEVLRDYLLLMIFTGLRRQEGAQLKWRQVDLNAKTLTISNTKNNLAHTLPIPDFIEDIFKQRKESSVNEYVFPGTGAGGYIVEPRKQMVKVIESSGISFILHDLRRTFLTVAESLDISAYAVKRLANHKMNNDVTSGYIITDVERLRKPMQQIADYFMKCMGIKETEITHIASNHRERVCK
ncbi:MAG: integrase family protein [Gammaproteobacteria bacterium]|nr:integrase family protein [Gammaproteobacteria bacterium]